jgi:hypothetical protein
MDMWAYEKRAAARIESRLSDDLRLSICQFPEVTRKTAISLSTDKQAIVMIDVLQRFGARVDKTRSADHS